MVGMLIPLITVTLQFTNIYCTLSLPTLKYSAPWSYKYQGSKNASPYIKNSFITRSYTSIEVEWRKF